MIRWTGEERFELGQTTFVTMPPVDLLAGRETEIGESELFVFKPADEVEYYVDLIRSREPKRILELGIFGGGSTLFLADIAGASRFVALDITAVDELREKIDRLAAANGVGPDVIRLHGGVDQSDTAALDRICEEDFGGHPIDLIIDDASHQYLPTLASFNALFPRLRPGGVYIVEDWRWAHSKFDALPTDGSDPDQVPITRLLLEAIAALAEQPGIVAGLSVEPTKVLIERGDAEIEPGSFDLAANSNPRGRTFLGAGAPAARKRGLFR